MRAYKKMVLVVNGTAAPLKMTWGGVGASWLSGLQLHIQAERGATAACPSWDTGHGHLLGVSWSNFEVRPLSGGS